MTPHNPTPGDRPEATWAAARTRRPVARPVARPAARPVARLAALLAVTLLALLGTACGSTDDPEAASASSAAATDTTEAATDTTDAAAPATTEAPPSPTTTAPSWPLTAPAPKLPATVQDASGATVTVASIDRIASLQGDITEILWTLGLEDNIAVVDTTSVYPASILAEKPNAGFIRQLSAESILAQQPTVVLVHPGAGPPEALQAVRDAGVPVVVIADLNTPQLSDAAVKIRAVGAAVGLDAHAGELADFVEADIEAAAAEADEAAGDDRPVGAYIVPRGQQVFLTGVDNPSNAIIAAAGGTPAAELLGLATAAPLTPEALIGVQPAFLVSTHTGVEQAGGEAAFLAMAGIAETPAAQQGRLLVFDDTFIQQLGPRTGQAIREVAAELHGS